MWDEFLILLLFIISVGILGLFAIGMIELTAMDRGRQRDGPRLSKNG